MTRVEINLGSSLDYLGLLLLLKAYAVPLQVKGLPPFSPFAQSLTVYGQSFKKASSLASISFLVYRDLVQLSQITIV